ncbi:MAG: hypothetical protein ACE5O2_03875 [Armatimonadota bacterium]
MLARFDDGGVAMLEERRGTGRTILVNMAPDGSWNNAPRQTAFVPFVHRLTYHVARKPRGGYRDVLVGQQPSPGVPEPAQVKEPGGSWAAPAGFRATRVGFYEVRERPGGEAAAFAANVEPAESDLTRLSSDELKAVLRGLNAEMVTPAQLSRRLASGLPRRVALSWVFLVFAMVALIADLIVSSAGRTASAERLGGRSIGA